MVGVDEIFTLRANVPGAVPTRTVSTPVGRNFVTAMLIASLSGTGRFHVMSQLGDSVGNAQAEASIASAIIPTSGRRMCAVSLLLGCREEPFAAEAGVLRDYTVLQRV